MKHKSEVIQCPHYRWRIIKRAGNGMWYADGRGSDIALGRHSLGTRDRDEALSALQELDRIKAVEFGLIDASALLSEAGHLVELKRGVDIYMSYVRRPAVRGGARPRTIKRYQAIFDKFLPFAHEAGLNCWNALSLRILDRYATWLDDEGYAYATEYIELTTIKQLFNHLIAVERLIPTSRQFELKLDKPQGTTTYCYQIEQVDAMLARCGDDPALYWLGGVIVALAYTGLRIAELAGLRWSNIDLTIGMMTLPDNTRSGDRSQRERAQSTKGKRDRTLPIHDRLIELFSTMRATDDGFVFHGPRGGRLKADTVRNTLVRDVVTPLISKFPTPAGESGFKDGRLHSFRHFFCSFCAHRGVPEQVVMRWLGHQDSKVVKRYYHLHDEESRRQMNKLASTGDTLSANGQRGNKDVAGTITPTEPSTPTQTEDGATKARGAY